jgi:hypothetical protein
VTNATFASDGSGYISNVLEWLSQLDPRALLIACILVGTIVAFPLLASGIGRLAHFRVFSGVLILLLGAVVLVAGLAAGVVASSLHTYRRLTEEQVAAKVTTRQVGQQQYLLTLDTPRDGPRTFQVLGDQWQIDARVVKWRPMATVAGFDTLYRLERLSGRYASEEQERTAPRSVHRLARNEPVDVWQAIRAYRSWLPMVDAQYGSAAYVPLAPQASYAVTVSASGLVVRPENDAARRAVGGWK